MDSITTFRSIKKSISRRNAISIGVAGFLLVLSYNWLRQKKHPQDLPSLHWLEALKHDDDWNEFAYKVTVQFGGKPWIFDMPFFGRMIVFSSPEAMEYHFKTGFEFFEKGAQFQAALEPLLGHGIFVVDGENWRSQRKAISNIFTVRAFRDFYSKVFVEKIKMVCDILGKAADSEAIINLHDLFHRFSLDSFCSIAFGYDLNILADMESGVEFCTAFNQVQAILGRRFSTPFWWLEENIGSNGRILKDNIATLEKMVYKVIIDRRNSLDQKEDLLSRFMNLKDENGNSLDDKMLRDLVLNMLLAGRDTTAEALSWTTYLLTKYDHFLPRIREESNLLSENPTYEEIQNLKFTHATFLEGLRLHPSVPENIKRCVADTVFPDGTIVLKGDFVVWSSYTMGRLESLWGPDARDFNPKRWLEQDVDGKLTIKQESPFKYPQFNAGPRICLGMNMAILEGKAALGIILRDFDFEVMDDPPVISQPSITHLMKWGMSVRVRKRTIV